MDVVTQDVAELNKLKDILITSMWLLLAVLVAIVAYVSMNNDYDFSSHIHDSMRDVNLLDPLLVLPIIVVSAGYCSRNYLKKIREEPKKGMWLLLAVLVAYVSMNNDYDFSSHIHDSMRDVNLLDPLLVVPIVVLSAGYCSRNYLKKIREEPKRGTWLVFAVLVAIVAYVSMNNDYDFSSHIHDSMRDVNLLDPLLVVPIVVVSAALYAFTSHLSNLKKLIMKRARKPTKLQSEKDAGCQGPKSKSFLEVAMPVIVKEILDFMKEHVVGLVEEHVVGFMEKVLKAISNKWNSRTEQDSSQRENQERKRREEEAERQHQERMRREEEAERQHQERLWRERQAECMRQQRIRCEQEAERQLQERLWCERQAECRRQERIRCEQEAERQRQECIRREREQQEACRRQILRRSYASSSSSGSSSPPARSCASYGLSFSPRRRCASYSRRELRSMSLSQLRELVEDEDLDVKTNTGGHHSRTLEDIIDDILEAL
eukprot:TRINITY_DN10067_c0_g2_i1.p1 TRINITY_DN10067_c0_g2~~TRINITY_DN10067_c0_g2_i1.p1  ORF type:complete len:489 (+),score=61.63 TRINITY_DN10067_c0_g2_i1:117-1583(+)